MPDTSPRARAIDIGRRSFGSGWKPTSIADAPGRLELLGNHVDYNGGLVLAGAIDRVVAVAASEEGVANHIDIVAGDISNEIAGFPVESCRDWRNHDGVTGPVQYARGVIASLLARDRAVRDRLQLAIAGNVPIGFGMSSSAGLCVALVLTLTPGQPDPVDVVKIAREAEHRCGNPVGAMDQSASIAGGVILFDGRDTSFTVMSPDPGDYVFTVADSGVSHALGESSYPVRVAESERALGVIRDAVDPHLPSLGELSPDQWASARNSVARMADPVLLQRVDHVVAEVERVRQGVNAVNSSDWSTFGQLMTESGKSSNERYEISHPKVEELVAQLLRIEGVLGAKMMGGGEGGPALALIHRDAVAEATRTLTHGFFRHNPSHLHGDRLQVCAFGPGAHLTRI